MVGVTFHVATVIRIVALFSVEVFCEKHIFDIYFYLFFDVCSYFYGFVGIGQQRRYMGYSSLKFWGEGSKQAAGSFRERMHYKSGDYRYTYRPCHIYAFALTKRKQKVFRLKKLGLSRDNFHFIIQGVKVLGYSDKVQWKISKKYLELRLEKPLDTKMPVCFEIKVD